MQIECGIKLSAAEVFDEGVEIVKGAGGLEAAAVVLAVEQDDLIEQGVVLDQSGTGGGDEPGNVGCGKTLAQGDQNGKCVDDISDSRGLDDQYAFGRHGLWLVGGARGRVWRGRGLLKMSGVGKNVGRLVFFDLTDRSGHGRRYIRWGTEC